jgi:hypothetical protein
MNRLVIRAGAALIAALPAARALAGADLVTVGVRFPDTPHTNTYSSSDPKVIAGCLTPGDHTTLAFELREENVGDGDAVVGSTPRSPAFCNSCPCTATGSSGSFVWNNQQCDWQVGGYYDFNVVTPTGALVQRGPLTPQQTPANSACLADGTSLSGQGSHVYSCRAGDTSTVTSGLQAGWFTTAFESPCMFIESGTLPAGEYRLVVTSNASMSVGEDRFNNNTFSLPFGGTNPAARWTRNTQDGTFVGYLPAAVADAPHHLSVFWSNGSVKTVRQDFDQWSPVMDLGAPPGATVSGTPAVVSWAPGRYDVFVRADDGSFWHNWGDGYWWGGWEKPGTPTGLATVPAAVSFYPGRLDVFWVTTDGTLGHSWWPTDVWGFGVEDLGKPPGASLVSNMPAVVSQGVNKLDIFAGGSDNKLWHLRWAPGWQPWDNPAGAGDVIGFPSATSWGPGRLDVFWRNSQNNLSHLWSRDGGVNFGVHGIAASADSSPTATSWGPGHFDVFYRDANNQLHRVNYDVHNNPYAPYYGYILDSPTTMDTDVATTPSAATWANGRLDIAFGIPGGNLGTVTLF